MALLFVLFILLTMMSLVSSASTISVECHGCERAAERRVRFGLICGAMALIVAVSKTGTYYQPAGGMVSAALVALSLTGALSMRALAVRGLRGTTNTGPADIFRFVANRYVHRRG